MSLPSPCGFTIAAWVYHRRVGLPLSRGFTVVTWVYRCRVGLPLSRGFTIVVLLPGISPFTSFCLASLRPGGRLFYLSLFICSRSRSIPSGWPAVISVFVPPVVLRTCCTPRNTATHCTFLNRKGLVVFKI